MHALHFRQADFWENCPGTPTGCDCAIRCRISSHLYSTVGPAVSSSHMLLWMLLFFVGAGVGEASVLGNEGWLDYSCFTAQFKPAVKLMQRLLYYVGFCYSFFFNTSSHLCTFLQTLPSARDEESLVFSCSAAPHRLLY